MPLRLSAIAALCGPVRAGASADPEVTGITHDSRAVGPGYLFLALPGERRHGAAHAADAVAAGAVAVLTDPSGADRFDLAMLGVPVLVVPDPRLVLGPVAAAVHGHPARDLALPG